MSDEQSAGERPAGSAERAAGILREILVLVDAGELDATPAERAHLAGAAAAVEAAARLG